MVSSILIWLFMAALALPIYHRGQSFSLELKGLDMPHVAWLTAYLVSDCDNEYVISSGGSKRVHGAYYAEFIVPDDAEPCIYEVQGIDFEVYGEDETRNIKPDGVKVEVQK